MMTKQAGQQLELHTVTIEDLMPKNHFLRKVDAVVDFGFIYEKVRNLYSSSNGRPSVDPVVLVKYLLIGLYGIESERRIEQEIEVNMAYRWFLGLDIGDRVPDHSTISQYRRRGLFAGVPNIPKAWISTSCFCSTSSTPWMMLARPLW